LYLVLFPFPLRLFFFFLPCACPLPFFSAGRPPLLRLCLPTLSRSKSGFQSQVRLSAISLFITLLAYGAPPRCSFLSGGLYRADRQHVSSVPFCFFRRPPVYALLPFPHFTNIQSSLPILIFRFFFAVFASPFLRSHISLFLL